jgi:hypothetical protein
MCCAGDAPALARRADLALARKIQIREPDQADLGRPVSLRKNISVLPSGKSGAFLRVSCPERGALRNVINAGRDAMDADALLTNSARRGRRSRVVLTPRRWRQVSREVFREATVAKEPGHRGEHEGNR